MPKPSINLGYDSGGPTGHLWVELDDGNGTKKWGSFAPKNPYTPLGFAQASGLVPGLPNDGEFQTSDPTIDKAGNVIRPRTYVNVPIDDEGYAGALRRIEELETAAKAKQLDYSAIGPHQNNCVDVTQDILRAAGRPEQIADFFPSSSLRESQAGVQALARVAPRSDDPGPPPMEFPDAAFPWPQRPATPAPAVNHFSIEQAAPSPSGGNLFNSSQSSGNLLNSAPERFRTARY